MVKVVRGEAVAGTIRFFPLPTPMTVRKRMAMVDLAISGGFFVMEDRYKQYLLAVKTEGDN